MFGIEILHVIQVVLLSTSMALFSEWQELRMKVKKCEKQISDS